MPTVKNHCNRPSGRNLNDVIKVSFKGINFRKQTYRAFINSMFALLVLQSGYHYQLFILSRMCIKKKLSLKSSFQDDAGLSLCVHISVLINILILQHRMTLSCKLEWLLLADCTQWLHQHPKLYIVAP